MGCDSATTVRSNERDASRAAALTKPGERSHQAIGAHGGRKHYNGGGGLCPNQSGTISRVSLGAEIWLVNPNSVLAPAYSSLLNQAMRECRGGSNCNWNSRGHILGSACRNSPIAFPTDPSFVSCFRGLLLKSPLFPQLNSSRKGTTGTKPG